MQEARHSAQKPGARPWVREYRPRRWARSSPGCAGDSEFGDSTSDPRVRVSAGAAGRQILRVLQKDRKLGSDASGK